MPLRSPEWVQYITGESRDGSAGNKHTRGMRWKLTTEQPQYNQEETTMNTDIIAEVIATSFNADRPALHRYSATVVLRAPDKTATRRTTGYGEDADSALNNAIRKALRYELMHAGTEVRVSSRTLPDGYGRAYLDEAYMCAECASRMPAGSQAYKDLVAVAELYEQQYLTARYDYLRSR